MSEQEQDSEHVRFAEVGEPAKRPAWLEASPPSVRVVTFPTFGEEPEAAGEPAREAASRPPPRSARGAGSRAGSGATPSAATAAPPPSAPAPQGPTNEDLLRLEQSVEAFGEAVARLATERERVALALEPALLELSIGIAEAILERELERDPEIYRGLIREALAMLGSDAEATVRASREAHAAILEVFDGPSLELDGRRARVLLDTTLEGLGCVVEAPESLVDAQIRSRLRAARRAMIDERGAGRENAP
ncbi:MAG: flagellar assembly protein FliH [Myxococcales bacterium]|nr:flagellar assembly protein FliH [Myxococcales bacterium]